MSASPHPISEADAERIAKMCEQPWQQQMIKTIFAVDPNTIDTKPWLLMQPPTHGATLTREMLGIIGLDVGP